MCRAIPIIGELLIELRLLTNGYASARFCLKNGDQKVGPTTWGNLSAGLEYHRIKPIFARVDFCVMNKFQLFFHHFFRFIWNAIFILSYPIMATFGLLFVGLTYLFSSLSSLLMHLRSTESIKEIQTDDWNLLNPAIKLIEAKKHRQIIFGPVCYQLRRTDGIPSVLEDHFFGQKTTVIEEGILLERWKSTDLKELPDFDICLYLPDEDKLSFLTNIKCFDWHLAEKEEKRLLFKWFDGTQGGEVTIIL